MLVLDVALGSGVLVASGEGLTSVFPLSEDTLLSVGEGVLVSRLESVGLEVSTLASVGLDVSLVSGLVVAAMLASGLLVSFGVGEEPHAERTRARIRTIEITNTFVNCLIIFSPFIRSCFFRWSHAHIPVRHFK